VRLVRLSEPAHAGAAPALDYGLHILRLGTLVGQLQAVHAVESASGRLARVRGTLRRLAALERDPRRAMLALRRLGAGLLGPGAALAAPGRPFTQ